jgi:DNA topoisomerase-2
MKPGQRKIMYTAFKTNLKKDVKVVQFAGEVAKLTEYRHGEQSLCETIVGMAQDFVGSNNLALLSKGGQFGTRLQGGKDAASPRYIFTKLKPIARKLFHPADDAILDFSVVDQVEPDYFVPLLPLVVINGCEGIGTGFSTTVLPHDPIDLLRVLRERAQGHLTGFHQFPSVPFYRGFTGKLEQSEPGKWTFSGKVSRLSAKEYEVTELPPGMWVEAYKAILEKMIAEDLVKDYKNYNTDKVVRFVVKVTEKFENDLVRDADINKAFKLVTVKHETNMMLFDRNGRLRKYDTVGDILDEFYQIRIDTYAKRKASLAKSIAEEVAVASSKARFIGDIVAGSLTIANRKRADIEKEIAKKGYEPRCSSYGYLLNMGLGTLTSEKIQELEQERKQLVLQLQIVENTTVEQMYITDLDALAGEMNAV